ncbi:Serine/threonine-protein kinase Sgk3 [Nymphon striatum]|nr:Serine/threonine-protein kinase Sgk3 [Nymphon striatum]
MDKGSGITENTTVSITKSETWEKHKKFTVYKVAVNSGGKSWFIFRRYNEFNKLFDVLKKQMPGFHMKLPGKKLFGNNFDPEFIKARREGLDNFIQKIMSDSALYNHPEVKTFLLLDNPKNCHEEEIEETSEDGVQIDDKLVDLGPTEKPHAKSSDFEFLKVIGKGSFGKVLLAKHKVELKIYAIKVLQKKMIIKRNETKHIMSERNVLLKNLHHPFLVGLHYSFQTSDKLYFVLDYVNGGEYVGAAIVDRNVTAVTCILQVVMSYTIYAAHGHACKDLKPENILLDSIGHIVLTDFGLCKEGIVGHNDTTTTFCGTPEYLAPEVIRKQAYDRSVDWWCLGAVLFEMLYGLLLQKDKSVRLGSGENDFLDIKLHPFFKSMDWNAVDAKEIEPPFNPNVNGSLDLKNIDPEFTKEPVPASLGKSHVPFSASVQDTDNAFVGFSYAPPLEDIM